MNFQHNITLFIRSNECEVTIKEVLWCAVCSRTITRSSAPTPAPNRIHFADLSYFYCFDCWLLLFAHIALTVMFPYFVVCCIFCSFFSIFLVIWIVLCYKQWQDMPYKRIKIHNLNRRKEYFCVCFNHTQVSFYVF